MGVVMTEMGCDCACRRNIVLLCFLHVSVGRDYCLHEAVADEEWRMGHLGSWPDPGGMWLARRPGGPGVRAPGKRDCSCGAHGARGGRVESPYKYLRTSTGGVGTWQCWAMAGGLGRRNRIISDAGRPSGSPVGKHRYLCLQEAGGDEDLELACGSCGSSILKYLQQLLVACPSASCRVPNTPIALPRSSTR